MSPLEWIDLVIASDLRGSARAVAMALARYADRSGMSWHGAKSLARASGLTERSAVRALRALDDVGVVKVVGRSDKRTVKRALVASKLASMQTMTQCHPDTVSPCLSVTLTQCHPDTVSDPPRHSVRPPLTQCQTPPDTVSPKGDNEEDNEEDSEEDNSLSPGSGDDEGRTQLELVPPEQPPPRPAPAWHAAWEQCADRWAAVAYTASIEGRPKKRVHRRPSSRTKGVGRDLAALVKAYDAEAVIRLIDWFESAPSAAFLRDSAARRGITTLRRHAERYDEMAAEWDADGRPVASRPRLRGECGTGYSDDGPMPPPKAKPVSKTPLVDEYPFGLPDSMANQEPEYARQYKLKYKVEWELMHS